MIISLSFLAAYLLGGVASVELPQPHIRSAAESASQDFSNSLNFLVLGDWGWNNFNQSLTAYEMGVYAWMIDAKFVVALGDNFYDDGVASTNDTNWYTLFHRVYDIQSLQVPWYAILGNHDYHGSVQAQIDRTYVEGENMWKMPAIYYEQSFDLPQGGSLSMVMVDTQLLDPYHDDTGAILTDPDWQSKRDVHLKWIDEKLAEVSATAKWVIVMGHYPIYSVGVNGDNKYLMADLLPLLLKHKVHAYFTAHDHNHQAFEIDGMYHFVSGQGGGRGPFGPEAFKFMGISEASSHIESAFSQCGFAFVEASSSQLTVNFVDSAGRIRYTKSLKNPHGIAGFQQLFAPLERMGIHPFLAGLILVGAVVGTLLMTISYLGYNSWKGYASAALAPIASLVQPKPPISLEMDMSNRSIDRLVIDTSIRGR
jgi:acid phosphatase